MRIKGFIKIADNIPNLGKYLWEERKEATGYRSTFLQEVHEIDPMKLINYGIAIVYLAKIPISRPFAMGRVDKKKKIPIIVFKIPRLGQSSRSAEYWTWVKPGFAKLKSMLLVLR